MSDVEVDVRGAVGWLTLNRPQRLNAISVRVIRELHAGLAALEDQGVRALVLTGAGRAFSAGADVKEWAAGSASPEQASWPERMHAFVQALYEFPGPTLAAVNGLAYGAGCDLTLACDFRVGSASARFCEAYMRLAIPPDCGGTFLLPRIVGEARALDLILTGREVGAEEALAMGLLNEVAPVETFLARVEAWADRLGQGPTVALRSARDLVRRSRLLSLGEALAAERATTARCEDTDDHRAALAGAVDKSPVHFVGH